MSVEILGTTGISSVQDGIITEGKIGVGAVTNTKIGALAVDNGKIANSAINSSKIADGGISWVDFPSGTILQVVSSTLTSPILISGVVNDYNIMSLSITPKSTSSKILLMINISYGNDAAHATFRLKRDSTLIAAGDGLGSRTQGFAASEYTTTNTNGQNNIGTNYLDLPNTTSQITYYVNVSDPYSTSYAIRINSSLTDGDGTYNGRTISTITALEIKG